MATKPSWAKTRVPWEWKVEVWNRMSLGDSDSKVGTWLELHGHNLDRETISKVREELRQLPQGFIESLPNAVQEYWKEFRKQPQAEADERGIDPREVRKELQHQNLLAHYQEIRRLGTEVYRYLPFPPPYSVDLSNMSGVSGEITNPFGGPTLGWDITPDGHCLRKLEGKMVPLLDHLLSSGENGASEAFTRWQELGGSCIKKLHALREEIIKEARKRTNLDMVASEPPQKGMLYDFWRSIYTWAVSTVDDEEYYTCHYMVASRAADLCLLQMKGEANMGRVLSVRADSRTLANLPPALHDNLAWINNEELSAVTAAHKQMWAKYREFPLAVGIRRLAGQLAEVEDELAEGIGRLAKEELLPGKCSDPICNPWIGEIRNGV